MNNSRSELCLALDLGGTKLMIGAVDRSGEIIHTKTFSTGYRDHREAAAALYAGLEEYLSQPGLSPERFSAIGMGLVGRINSDRGVWERMYGGDDHAIPVAEAIQERFGLACYLDNDVKVATRAERRFGMGRQMTDFVYVNIGTGIAAGIVSGGRILRGRHNDAGEIGHMVVDSSSDAACSCGKRGCVEVVASGRGMMLRAEGMAGSHPHSAVTKAIAANSLDVLTLFQAADSGDPLARKVTMEATDALIHMLDNLHWTFDPEMLILGGGVVSDGWMLRHMQDRIPKISSRLTPGNLALSGLNVKTLGLLGASVLAFEGLDQTEKGRVS